MDDLVKQAMAKWPQVPDCYGWLGLDMRGNWFLRDDAAQAAGTKGDRLEHAKLIEFIHRNYSCDASGQWFFQNGPQRVFVELQAAPFVWRIGPASGDAADIAYALTAHTGTAARMQRCLVDEAGWLYLDTDIGLGLVHTLDMESAAQAISEGLWVPQDIAAATLEARFGFVRSPQQRHHLRAALPE